MNNEKENILNQKGKIVDPIWLFKLIIPITSLILIISLIILFNSYKKLDITNRQLTKFEKLRDDIIYYDEVLTMSARVAIIANDLAWKERYDSFVPKLDNAIKEAIELSPGSYEGNYVNKMNKANQALIVMETKSFNYLKENKIKDAQDILFGSEYIKQKELYAKGLQTFSKKLIEFSTTELENQNKNAIISFIMVICLFIGKMFGLIYLINLMKIYKENLLSYQNNLEDKVKDQTYELQLSYSLLSEKSKKNEELIHVLCHD